MCGELQHFFGYSTPSAGGNFTPHLSTSLFSWFHFQFIENSGLECCESNKQLNWCITHFSIRIRTSLANNNLRLKMKMKIFQFDVCAFMDHFIQTATVPTKINQPLPHWLDSLTIPFLSFMNDFGSFLFKFFSSCDPQQHSPYSQPIIVRTLHSNTHNNSRNLPNSTKFILYYLDILSIKTIILYDF